MKRGFAAQEKEMRINLLKNSLLFAMVLPFAIASQKTLYQAEAQASYPPIISLW
jgi:hypothetical protein